MIILRDKKFTANLSVLAFRDKLFSPGVGGESFDSLRRLYEKNVAANPEFANTSRGRKLMDRIKYEQGYIKPTPNVPATIQKPITNVPTTIQKPITNVPATIQKPITNAPTATQKLTPNVSSAIKKSTSKWRIPKIGTAKIGTAGKILGSAAIIGSGILAANALTNKE